MRGLHVPSLIVVRLLINQGMLLYGGFFRWPVFGELSHAIRRP